MRNIIRRIVFGLRWRLLVLVLLASAPLVGLMLRSGSEERRRLIKDWSQRSQDMMELATREERDVVSQTRQLLLVLAESAPVKAGNWWGCKKLLDELFGSNSFYFNLGVVGANGVVLASARPLAEPANQTNRQFFRRTVKNRAFAVGDFPDSRVPGDPTLTFGYPVFDTNGQVQAVVFAALNLNWVCGSASALPAQLPKGAIWTEVERTGRILVRYPSPETWMGRHLLEPALLQYAFRQTNGVVETLSADGVSSYHAFTAMRSHFFSGEVVSILSSVPSQTLFAEADRRLTENLTGLGITATLAFGLSWLGSYLMVLRPVRTLVKSSTRLATGDLSARTRIAHRGDEPGQLSRAFDQMAQALERREAQRQAADHALRISETRYRRLFETAQDGILILDAETGQIDDVNPFLTNLLGYTREQMLGNKLWDIGPFKDTKASKAGFRELQREAYVRYEDLPLESSAGRSINVEFVSNVYQSNGDRVVQCNIRDITERKQAEAKRKVYSRKLQVLSRRLVDAQDTERRNIARELHDEIGQALTVIELNLQAMLQSPGIADLTPRLNESLKVVERVLEQVRDISLDLRPSILDDLGLEPALRWYTNRQAALVGLQVEFHSDRLERRLDSVIETECFRVAQAALTNVVRHAQAKSVTVELREQDGRLHLFVRDDGIGFSVSSVREKAVGGASLGLLSMEERAGLADGGLEFTSSPGRGTEVHAWFPLRLQNSASESETP